MHWCGAFRQSSRNRQSSAKPPHWWGWGQPCPRTILSGHTASPPASKARTVWHPLGSTALLSLHAHPPCCGGNCDARLMSGGITSHKGQASWQGRGGRAGRKGKRSPGQRQAASPAPHVRRGAAAGDGTAPSPLIALVLRKERQHPISQCPSQEPQCCPAELQRSMPRFKDVQKNGTQVYLNLFLQINQFHLLHLSQTVAAADQGKHT